MKNENTFTYNNVQDSIPKATTGTGTISNANNSMIVGVSTKFLTEAKVGDYIYIKAQNDFRRVETVVSDTVLYINSDFGSALSGAAFGIVKPRYTRVKAEVIGAGAALIDGVSHAKDKVAEFSKASDAGESGRYVLPIDIDAATNNTIVNITVDL